MRSSNYGANACWDSLQGARSLPTISWVACSTPFQPCSRYPVYSELVGILDYLLMANRTVKLTAFHVYRHFDALPLASGYGRAGIRSSNKWRTLHLSVSATIISIGRHDFQRDRLNGSTKTIALVGAALLLLDFAATAVVSAATASSYLAGEVALPFPFYVGPFLVFVLFTAVSLLGLRESARVASAVLAFHVCR